MKQINKIYIFWVITAFLGLWIFSSCTGNGNDLIIDSHFVSQPDTSIFLDSFPSDVLLELGKSVLIENGVVIVKFVDIIEKNGLNSQVQLEIEYVNNDVKNIFLNTNDTPQTYNLENGFNHEIVLKGLSSTWRKYNILFTYNEFFRL